MIEIAVSYTLREYLSFVQEHLSTILLRARQGNAESPPPISRATRCLIVVAASLSFMVKKFRMPLCEFYIDEHHIRRRTALGDLVVPWSDVVAVHRYSAGYLIEKSRGSMPLPYRAFTASQSEAFSNILVSVQVKFQGLH